MNKMTLRLGKGVSLIIEGLAIIGFGALVIMMLIGVWGTVANWLGFSAPGVMEFSEILNVLVICLPMAYVTLKRRHIEIDLVTTFLRPRPKRNLHFATLFPLLFFSAMLAWRLTPQAVESTLILEKSDTGGFIPAYYWPGKWAVAIGFIGMTLVLIYQIIHYFRGGKLLEGER